MKIYSEDRKESVLKKMMPPINVPVSQLVKETGISDCTLYTWHKEARLKGVVVPGKTNMPADLLLSVDIGAWYLNFPGKCHERHC